MSSSSGVEDNDRKCPTGAKKIPPPPDRDCPSHVMDEWLHHPKIVKQPGYPRLEKRDFVKFNADLDAFIRSQRELAAKRARLAERKRQYRKQQRKEHEEEALLVNFVNHVKELSEIDQQIHVLQKRKRMIENGQTSE